MKKMILAAMAAFLVVACGGGGSGTAASPSPQPIAGHKLAGEVVATASQLASSELRTNAGYAGNVPTSYAIQSAGQENMLNLLFMLSGAGTTGRNHDRLADDAEENLARYVRDHAALLTPGVRLLVLDEVYWNPPDARDSVEVLQPQLEALAAAVSMVRRYVPHARIGITVTPYAMTDRPNTLEYARRAIALVDWVATDPYWFGDPANVQSLLAWSGSFHALARQANPRVETWFIAQAFKFPEWDNAVFARFIEQQLRDAEQYDHILFFGWQFTSELDPATAGTHFPAETKRLYSKYLK
jgi:hypothetical protein